MGTYLMLENVLDVRRLWLWTSMRSIKLTIYREKKGSSIRLTTYRYDQTQLFEAGDKAHYKHE